MNGFNNDYFHGSELMNFIINIDEVGLEILQTIHQLKSRFENKKK